jgi:hypothetical protein
MRLIDDESEITSMSMQKAHMEMELARSLYFFFSAKPQISPLRNLVYTAISSLVADLDGPHRNFAQRNIFEVVVKKSGNKLAVFTGRGMSSSLRSLRHLLTQPQKNTWTAADCSDLIRFFGELVENKMIKGNYGFEGISPDLHSQKNAWRPPVHFDPSARARIRGQDYEPAQSGPHVAAARAVMLALRRNEAGFSGINITLLNRGKSTVWKIDYAYGLAEGCDISGTTTDSLFFHTYLEPFCTTADVPSWMFEILHLLPIATMVYQAHHSLLECALAISCNQRTGTEYSVGKYYSLLPRGRGPGALQGLLRRYDHDHRNHRMLCYLDPATYSMKANYYDKPAEWDEFHRVSTFRNDQFLITKFLTAPLPITRQVLQDIFREGNLDI